MYVSYPSVLPSFLISCKRCQWTLSSKVIIIKRGERTYGVKEQTRRLLLTEEEEEGKRQTDRHRERGGEERERGERKKERKKGKTQG